MLFVQPHQDHADRRGAVCTAADSLPACAEAPPDVHLHRLHRRQQGQSAVWLCLVHDGDSAVQLCSHQCCFRGAAAPSCL